MIDDEPEGLNFDQLPTRQKAAHSLAGSIGWQLIEHDLRAKIKEAEESLMADNLKKKARAKLLGRREAMLEMLALPAAIIGHRHQ